MSFGEFLAKTIIDSRLNRCLGVAALGVIGGGIEYCREADGELKLNSALLGITTFTGIAMLAGVAYKSYKDFNMYTSGITALCTVMGAYLCNSYTKEMRARDAKEEMSDIQCIIMGAAIAAAIAASLAAMACNLGQVMLSR